MATSRACDEANNADARVALRSTSSSLQVWSKRLKRNQTKESGTRGDARVAFGYCPDTAGPVFFLYPKLYILALLSYMQNYIAWSLIPTMLFKKN